MPTDHKLDARLHAARADLADIRLKGRVEADRFVAGEPAHVCVSLVDLRPAPALSRGIDTQLLFGEPVSVFDRANGFAWVQSGLDGYVGYVPEETISTTEPSPTHLIAVPRSFVYSGPDLRLPRRHALSLGSRLAVTGEAETRGTRYLLLADGSAVVAAHCRSVHDAMESDYVAIAARLLETPYLWGGRSAFGIDCSGLVQLSLQMVGERAPRDSDMQATGLGQPILQSELVRGDLVFWKGHVGIMEDENTLLHANGHTMSVAREDLDGAIARIAWLYQQPTGFRRPLVKT
ncbi:C40 family peptidase [Peteryoungia desertarenae]|uniref:C40 family peptidase n=2 Tax=Peteryoungia desertarenae TaxID=1813451 RepID=A0ABX6QKK9_9HYPH|nr:NlpC/P60 family protein [Peteryoungia desertarenae]QLF69094.1 C40 family peptidase [Peteryoungia desertarenae]